MLIKRKEPPLGSSPDYSCAIYPDPPSHDFCVWLIIAELSRRQHEAPGPLKVKFAFANDQLGTIELGSASLSSGDIKPCILSRQYSDLMLDNILRPAIEMIGAVERSAVTIPLTITKELSRYVEYDYHIWQLVDAGRAGLEIPRWNPPQWAHDEVRRHLGNQRPVIITLREVDSLQPERNSRIADWLRFAASIEGEYPVLFLRDTAKVDDVLPLLFPTWKRASTNAYVRAALYQQALVNMMVCNGPNTWCIFSDAPYLIFKELVPALPEWDHGHPRGWMDQDHMEVGDQYAWATPQQRLTWTDDTFENIRAAFDEFVMMSPEKARRVA